MHWIRCSDQLPADCTPVLITWSVSGGGRGDIDIAQYNRQSGQWCLRDDRYGDPIRRLPTHWMRLPDLPVEVP